MRFLRRNIELNGLHGHVVLEQAALGAEEGDVEFTIGLDTANHVARGREPKRTRRVSMRTLDKLESSPTMIKVDVEGYEADVFRGAQAVLKASTLKAVITEGQRPTDITPLLNAGFAQYEYDPFQRRLNPATRQKPCNNALFLRDISFVTERISSSAAFHILGYTI